MPERRSGAVALVTVYVTRIDAHDKLDSIVLEWNGTELRPIAEKQNWYFRVGTLSYVSAS